MKISLRIKILTLIASFLTVLTGWTGIAIMHAPPALSLAAVPTANARDQSPRSANATRAMIAITRSSR